MQKDYEASSLDNIVVRPVYLRAVNAIVQPEIQVPCSLYFFQKWLPRLGALRWALVLTLRTICTQRQPDGTNRGEITRSELANALGVHEATISRILNTAPSTIHHGWRVLQPLTNDDHETVSLAKFVPRLRYKYERDQAAGVTRRVGYIIDVIMDDPLVPEDEERLAVILAEQVLQSLPPPQTVKKDDALTHYSESQSAPDASLPLSGAATRWKTENTTVPRVKSQNAISINSVTVQNASPTRRSAAQIAASHLSVNQQNAPYSSASAQESPTLTLTNNYIYRDVTIDLSLTKKRDIRAAVTPLVEMASASLNDHHSKGMFFSTLTQLYPHHLDVFTRALEIAEREGKISREINLGAVFVNAIKALAAEEGVTLRLGKEQKRGAQKEEGRAVDETDVVDIETTEAAPMVHTAYSPLAGIAGKQLWQSVLQELKGRTTRGNYEMWLRNCEILGFDGEVLVLGAPSAFARDWINERLLMVIQHALRQVVGKDLGVRCEIKRSVGKNL